MPFTPLTISHRGAHGLLPENTIPAFTRAIEAGADAIELDVHLTLDGTLVVHHDADFLTEDGGQLPICSTDLARLREIRNDPALCPTLDDVMDAVGTRATLFIETKVKGAEIALLRAVRESECDCAVHSFDHRVSLELKSFFPALRTGILQVSRPVNPVETLARSRADDLWQHVDFTDEELVREVQSAGKRVIVWTANNPADWKRLVKLGVDGVCTDRITDLAALKLSRS